MKNESQAATTSTPLDLATIGMLQSMERRTGKNLLADLADLFVGDGLLEALRAAYQKGDDTRLGELAHQLKGRSATVGATCLAELCLDLEASLRDRDRSRCTERVEEIEREYGRVAESLQAIARGSDV